MRLVLIASLMLVGGAAQAQVDPSFAPCAACHAVKPGQNRIGPSLHGIVGAKKAAAPNFNYSVPFKGLKGNWTEKELDAFIANPRAQVPGTKMFYVGMTDAAKRAKLLAYLKSLK